MCQEGAARTRLRLAQNHDAITGLEGVQASCLAIQSDQCTRRRDDVPFTTTDAHHVEAIAEHGLDRAGQTALRDHFLRGGPARRR